MRLFELFDKIANYEKAGHGSYTFKTSSYDKYKVVFREIENYRRDWLLDEDIVDSIVEVYFLQYDGAWLSTGITGAGNAFEVMATVLEIMKDYLTQMRPPIIFFSADNKEVSRTRLYDRMVKSVSNIDGYDLLNVVKGKVDTYYIFKRV